MEENTSKVYVGPAASLLREPMLAAGSAGSPLFVINLCASIAPIAVAGKTIPGLESYRLYQVARNEDGRTRHRLRLGFFALEADAERALAAVRDSYPTAFTTCLSDDDRKFTRGFVPAAPVAAPVRKGPVGVESIPRPAKPSTANVTEKPAVVTAAEAPAIPRPTAAQSVSAPQGKAASTPDAAVDLELSWEPPALQAAAPQSNKAQPAPAVAQTLAPGFKTGPVIKSKLPEPARPVAKAAAQTATPALPKTPIEFTLAAENVVAKPEPRHADTPAQPFHVGKGVEIPAMSLSLDTQTLKAIAPAAAAQAPAEKKPAIAPKAAAKPVAAAPSIAATPAREPLRKETATPAVRPAMPVSNAPPVHAAKPARHQVVMGHPAPELDSTQTIRALTSAELNDDAQEKWFAIQLVVSEQPVNLDAMPHLDIFEAYRLYSVANAGSGKILHSLRIGFFREQVSAEAVSGYLKTFFPSPSVLRISAAEQLRFKDAPAPKAVSAKNDAKVIELNNARDRPARATVPTVTMEVAVPHSSADKSPTGTFRSGATGSFKTSASGSYKVGATGSHKALKPAAKSAGLATKRSASSGRASSSGKFKTLPKKSLGEQLLDEAREVELSESAIRKLPKNDSLLSRLVGKLTK